MGIRPRSRRIPRDGAAHKGSEAPVPSPPGRIFISYRRDDTSGFAQLVYKALSDHFGPERIFRDHRSIKLGADFTRVIEDSVDASQALVAVIGQDWLSCTNPDGGRRLDAPDDFVRAEIARALDRGILVIPVLVEEAEMPPAAALPEPLAPLVNCHALNADDHYWNSAMAELIQALDEVVTPPEPAPSPQGWSAHLRRITRNPVLVAIVSTTIVATALGVVPFLRKDAAQPLMSGDFNIAVAEFSAVDDRGRAVENAEGAALAQSVYDRLGAELQGVEQSGFDLQLRAPDDIGDLKGASPVERADAAAATARKLGADLIVYGTIDVEVPGQFVPEFYVSEAKLLDAEEFLGQHQLGTGVQLLDDPSRNPVARKALRDQVLGRAGALAEFVVGLSYASLEQWQPAIEHFRKAEAAVGWPDADGKEVLYLFLGNAAAKLHDLKAAGSFYDRALTLNPEYSRARIGVGEVLLQVGRGKCEPGSLDGPTLTRSLETFAAAQRSRIQPPLADIATKVAFGQGRAYLCLSQGLVADRWGDAERAFKEVIGEFDRGNPRIRVMAAESHSNLGFLYLPSAGSSDSEARFRQAAAEYQRAIDLFPETRDPQHRRALSWRMLGFIHGRLGETAKAEEAYQRAITLAGDDASLRSRYEEERRQLGK